MSRWKATEGSGKMHHPREEEDAATAAEIGHQEHLPFSIRFAGN